MTYSLSSIWLPNAKSQHLLFWSRHPNVVILNNISSGQSWLPASRPWDSVRDGQHCVAHGHWLSEQMKRIWGESISMPPKPKWWLCCRIHGQWTMAHLSRLHSNYPYIPSPGKAVPCVSFRRSQCYFPKFSHSSIFKAQIKCHLWDLIWLNILSTLKRLTVYQEEQKTIHLAFLLV